MATQTLFPKHVWAVYRILNRVAICQLPLSSEDSKLFSFREASPPDPWPGALPLDPAGGSAPDPRYNPPTANALASPLRNTIFWMAAAMVTMPVSTVHTMRHMTLCFAIFLKTVFPDIVYFVRQPLICMIDLPPRGLIPFLHGIGFVRVGWIHVGTGMDSFALAVCWPTTIVAGLYRHAAWLPTISPTGQPMSARWLHDVRRMSTPG